MQSPPIPQAEIDARIGSHIDELLELWWAEQGASKPRDLELIALAVPLPRGQAIRALDLCCGPGDVGRAIRQVYPKAQIDCIDRDPFLTSICRAVNQRDRIPGKLVVRDLEDAGWLDELPGGYDVVATVNALHWFDARRAAQLVEEVHGTLTDGGLFLLAEPTTPEAPFAAGFEEWKAKQPPRYTRENWERFWSAMTTQHSGARAAKMASATACRSRGGRACSNEPASGSSMCCSETRIRSSSARGNELVRAQAADGERVSGGNRALGDRAAVLGDPTAPLGRRSTGQWKSARLGLWNRRSDAPARGARA
jgi:SAM-dependent methyltransferase